jgi:hypothetical protein
MLTEIISCETNILNLGAFKIICLLQNMTRLLCMADVGLKS